MKFHARYIITRKIYKPNWKRHLWFWAGPWSRLVMTSPSHGEGPGFKSPRAHQRDFIKFIISSSPKRALLNRILMDLDL